MRLLPSDPDVETIISRIESNDLNLQPDFQRGEVWSRAKKQRLVDSILRDWHVPPIHVIELEGSRKQEVLDGQQRLVAIRDFFHSIFPIDGTIEPLDSRILDLHGLLYRDLPNPVRRQFHQFTIRIFRIVDYKSSEPSELFFRLNQPTNLTSAEQRNAFFGEVRRQIRSLVQSLEGLGIDKAFLGFSNSRMAYDDVLARVALTVERGSISEKISSSDLVDLYRSDDPISSETEGRMHSALATLGEAARFTRSHPRFNKATLYSWLIFIIRANSRAEFDARVLADFMHFFEDESVNVELGLSSVKVLPERTLEWIYRTYLDRSTSRVADVSSVVLRDYALWTLYAVFRARSGISLEESLPHPVRVLLDTVGNVEAEMLAKQLADASWGDL